MLTPRAQSLAERVLSTLRNGFIGTVQIIAVAAFAFIVLITFTNIARRFIGVQSYLWVEETARVLLIWLTFLGGTLAVFRGTHLTLDFFTDQGPRTLRRVITAIVTAASLAFFGLLTYEGWKYSTVTSRRVLPSLEISAGWMVNSAVVGGILFTVALALRIVQRSVTRSLTDPIPNTTADALPGADD